MNADPLNTFVNSRLKLGPNAMSSSGELQELLEAINVFGFTKFFAEMKQQNKIMTRVFLGMLMNSPHLTKNTRGQFHHQLHQLYDSC